jgi:hypothetical protein
MSEWLDTPPALADGSVPAAADEAATKPGVETIYPDSESWVTDWLYAYSPTPSLWCAHWVEHPPAAARLHALWEAWEVAQADGPPAMSSWWNYHHDTHLAALTASRGPFAACQQGHRRAPVWRDHVAPQR